MSTIPQSIGAQFAHLASLAPSPRPLMQPATIICQNVHADGAVCGETALIHGVKYIFGRELSDGANSMNHLLRESHYTIDCPRCGRRTQVEKYD